MHFSFYYKPYEVYAVKKNVPNVDDKQKIGLTLVGINVLCDVPFYKIKKLGIVT